jgi:flagellar hook-associated protein 3 FlgL
MALSSINISRVSQGLQTFSILDSLRKNSLELFEQQQRLATGNRFNAPSDDPVLATQAVDLTTLLERQDQLLENIKTADTFLGITDDTMNEISALLNDAYSLAQEHVEDFGAAGRSEAALVVDAIIDELIRVGNRTYAGSYLFGGRKTDTPPLVKELTGVSYVGDTGRLEALVELNATQSFSVSAQEVFGTLSAQVRGFVDLNPNLTTDTRLADLTGANGLGVRLGEIVITENGGAGAFTVDLAGADRISDVVDKINAASVTAGATITASLTNTGLQIVDGGGNTFSVTESGTGTTASDLGILQTTLAAGPLVGADLDPKLTLLTPVTALAGGAGIDLTNGIQLVQGLKTTTVNFAAATTVQDILNAINNVDGIDARAFINDTQTGIDVLNPLSGIPLRIGESGGATASDLGIRSLYAGTQLSELNRGAGVRTVTGADIRIVAKDGTNVDVDLSTAASVQDVINLINTAAAAVPVSITADLAATGNGIRITDATGGAGDLDIQRMNFSEAGTDLGLLQKVTGTQIQGTDVNAVVPAGVFTALIDLRDALLAANPDAARQGIQRAAPLLDKARDEVIRAHGRVGARSQAMQTSLRFTEEAVLATQSLLSEVKDLDYAEAVTQFQQAQTTLEANLLTGSRLLQISLLDFLR